jgi:glycerophosphoryl diester phosphodiesterase
MLESPRVRWVVLLVAGVVGYVSVRAAWTQANSAPAATAGSVPAATAQADHSQAAAPGAPSTSGRPAGAAARAPTKPGPRAPRFPTEFQVTTMQGVSFDPMIKGNTLNGLRAAHAQGVRYVEVDLFTTADEVLVTAHEPGIRDCGDVRKMKAAAVSRCRLPGRLQVATLAEVLALPFAGIYLDLKETKQLEAAAPTVRRAAQAVVQARRQDDAVLMVYQAPDDVVQTIRTHGLRAGMKGYPEHARDTLKLVRRAAAVGFEMVCVKARHVTPELVRESHKLGVWHLPWSVSRNQPHWQALAQAGIGGMIVQQYRWVRDHIAPYWVNPHKARASAGE